MEKNDVNKKYEYTIRYNTSLIRNSEDIPPTTNERTYMVNQ